MKKIFCMTILISFSLYVFSQTTDEIDKILRENFSQEVVELLSKPDSIIFYEVIEATENDTLELLDLYWKVGDSRILDGGQKISLLNILILNPHNYDKMILLSSDYVPEMGFRLFKNGKFVDLIISFSDKTWVILRNDYRIFRNRYLSSVDDGKGVDVEKFLRSL